MSMINVKPSIKKVFEMSGVLKLIPIEEVENIGGTEFEECVWKWNEVRVFKQII